MEADVEGQQPQFCRNGNNRQRRPRRYRYAALHGATAGINEYISVILADNSGAQYYGRVAQPTAENGTVEIKIPSGLAPGSYTLKVFSEQCNDDKKTCLLYTSDAADE